MWRYNDHTFPALLPLYSGNAYLVDILRINSYEERRYPFFTLRLSLRSLTFEINSARINFNTDPFWALNKGSTEHLEKEARGAPVVTKDEKILEYPYVNTIW